MPDVYLKENKANKTNNSLQLDKYISKPANNGRLLITRLGKR
jgi:hypothetical protein